MSFHQEIIDLILTHQIQTKEQLHKTKIKLCKKYNISPIPPDSEILAQLPTDSSEEEEELAISLLRKKPMRTISGVAIVAVMTSPESCPHGKCSPCPGGPEQQTPQSYTGYEPASMRASFNDYDPYLQTLNRLEQLRAIGHATDKIDLIVMGGTFTSRYPRYQDWFVQRCFDALNKKDSPSLRSAQKTNEIAESRCIGLTIETRPDWFRLQHIDQVLNLGATRVELGVQTVFDDILYTMNRGHTVTDTIYATQQAKNSGLKVCYHMMPGLPGSDEQRDLEAFRLIFEDTRFKPDMIKIYPTLTIEGTDLCKLWKAGTYTPLSTENAVRIIAQIKNIVPKWIRIQRIQRDVPAQQISSGVTKSNLRQLVEQEMKTHKTICRCIRCREIGHKSLKEHIKFDDSNLHMTLHSYPASTGTEIFLALEDKTNDVLIGYLRLRDVAYSHRPELTKEPCMIIREVKILGRELPIGHKTNQGLQHKGYGKELVQEAERLCLEEFDKHKLAVLSGIGVKDYYRKLGFSDDGVYLSKNLIR